MVDIQLIFSCLLISSCGLYFKIGKIHLIYINFFISILVMIMNHRVCIKIYKSSVIAFLFILYLFISSYIQNNITSALYNVLFSLVYYIISLEITKLSRKKNLYYAGKLLVGISIFLGLVDAIYRFENPVIKNFYTGINFIYKYKFGGIMYADSNFIGFYLVTIYFFLFYLRKYKNESHKVSMAALTLVILLTFSRSAIFTLIIGTFIMSEKINRKIKKIGFIFGGISGILLYTNYLINDVSFNSKFEIIEKAYSFIIKEMSLAQLLTGIGLGKTSDYLGIAAHNLLVTYIFETGLIGLFLLCFLWWTIYIESNKKVITVMFPVLLMGFSLVPHLITYVYCIYAIIVGLENKKQVVNLNSKIN